MSRLGRLRGGSLKVRSEHYNTNLADLNNEKHCLPVAAYS